MGKAQVDASVVISSVPIDVVAEMINVYREIQKVQEGHYFEIVFKDQDGKQTDRRTFRRTL